MDADESPRKWLSWRTLWNCLRLSAAIFVLAAIYKIAESAVMSNLRIVTKSIYIVFLWLVLAFALLINGLLSPELMEAVFKMLGFQQKEATNNEDRT
jgi:hypothetical protein